MNINENIENEKEIIETQWVYLQNKYEYSIYIFMNINENIENEKEIIETQWVYLQNK